MQVAQIQNETIIAASQRLCAFLPTAAATTCKKAIQKFEATLLSQWVLLPRYTNIYKVPLDGANN